MNRIRVGGGSDEAFIFIDDHPVTSAHHFEFELLPAPLGSPHAAVRMDMEFFDGVDIEIEGAIEPVRKAQRVIAVARQYLADRDAATLRELEAAVTAYDTKGAK